VLQELHTEEDRVVTLECVSRGGKPPAEVSKLFSSSLCKITVTIQVTTRLDLQ
jgi:hypothetical protein